LNLTWCHKTCRNS
jgi:hypothetical protein